MRIEKPYGNKHGKNEVAFPQLLQVFCRNRLIIPMLDIINYYYNSQGKDDDCKDYISDDFPDFHYTYLLCIKLNLNV